MKLGDGRNVTHQPTVKELTRIGYGNPNPDVQICIRS